MDSEADKAEPATIESHAPRPHQRGRETALLRAVRGTIRADSQSGRQNIFASLRRASAAARVATTVYDALGSSWLSTLFVSLYGLKSYLGLRANGPDHPLLMTVAVHENALHQVKRVASWFPGSKTANARATLIAPDVISRLFVLIRSPVSVMRALRVIHRVNQRRNFLVSCRVASTVACYCVARRELMRSRPGAVVVSSDNNPEETGFTAAARALGVPSVFISHAYPTSQSVPVDFDLSLLEGEAAGAARQNLGATNGAVVFIGLEGDSLPMDASRFEASQPVIGIFTPKVVRWEALGGIIEDCRRCFGPRQILIRWHPSMLETPRLGAMLTDVRGVTETPASATTTEIGRQCHWAIADINSNVHLQLLKVGVPTVAVARIGMHAPDRTDAYGFVASRVVFPPIPSITGLSVPDAVRFYGDGWEKRFAQFDAAYLRDEAAIVAEVRAAIEKLANASRERPT